MNILALANKIGLNKTAFSKAVYSEKIVFQKKQTEDVLLRIDGELIKLKSKMIYLFFRINNISIYDFLDEIENARLVFFGKGFVKAYKQRHKYQLTTKLKEKTATKLLYIANQIDFYLINNNRH